jgi:enoyl-CoA hydratase
MPHSLLIEHRGPVAVLTLNRPEKLNALNNQLISALTAALDEMELDRSVRAIVVTGAGRAFSAGADIAEFQAHMKAGPADAIAHFMRPVHRLTRRIEGYPKPVIAAVNGLAFGGCELVESIHLAFAADTTVFSKAEVNIGIIPTFGGTQRLPRHVGRKAAAELILSGRQFDAKEALDLASSIGL